MKDFYLADLHLGHDAAILGRPFASQEEMSAHIVDAINAKVATKYNRIICCGDFALRDPVKWRMKFICKNWIKLRGNHDPWHKCKLAFGEGCCRDTYDFKVKDHPCFASHYPHAYWPKSHRGSFHIYGHVHDQRTETIEAAFPGIRSLDVGVDSANRLLGDWTCFSEDEVYDILIARPGHDLVEWYETNRGKWKKEHTSE
jgi:calcineurin-like phosphoesterase family protein